MLLQQHPHYHLGFWESMEGHALHNDASPEYREGWLSFQEVKETLEGRPHTVREEYAKRQLPPHAPVNVYIWRALSYLAHNHGRGRTSFTLTRNYSLAPGPIF